MRNEPLLLSAGERPASVFFRGGEVRIDVHDLWYARTLRRLKADIVALHPDMALSGFRRRRSMRRLVLKAATYRYAQQNLKRWLQEQMAWYRTFGLEPVRVTGMARVTAPVYTKSDHGGSGYIIPVRPRYGFRLERSQLKRERLRQQKAE